MYIHTVNWLWVSKCCLLGLSEFLVQKVPALSCRGGASPSYVCEMQVTGPLGHCSSQFIDAGQILLAK